MAAEIVFWRLKVAKLVHRLGIEKSLIFLTSTDQRVPVRIPFWPELYSLLADP